MQQSTSQIGSLTRSPYAFLIEELKKQNELNSRSLFLFPTPQFLSHFLEHVSIESEERVPLACHVLKEWTFSILPALEITPLKAVLFLFHIFHKKENSFLSTSNAFEYFYPWGEVLVNDFRTIKRFQIDLQKIEKSFQNIENIIQNLRLKEEVKEVYRQIFRQEPPEHFGSFFEKRMEYRNEFHHLFTQFHKQLDAEGYSYYEYQLEKLIERIQSDPSDLFGPIESIHFCFFHSLYPLEKKAIEALAKIEGIKVHLWSLKPGLLFHELIPENSVFQKSIYHIHPEQLFHKNKHVHYHSITWDLKESEERFVFHKISYPIGEAKALNSLLVQEIQEGKTQLPIFILLFNPHFLFPLLNSIDYEQLGIQGGDIYVGIPLSETPFFHFLSICLDLWANQKEGRFRSYDLRRLLKHPYIENSWRKFLSQCVEIEESERKYRKGINNPNTYWERLLQINPYLSIEEFLNTLFGYRMKSRELPSSLKQIFDFPFRENIQSIDINQTNYSSLQHLHHLQASIFSILETLQKEWQARTSSTTQLENHLLEVFKIDLHDFFLEMKTFLEKTDISIQNSLELVQQLFSSLFKSHFLYLSVEKERKDLVIGDLEFILAHFPEQIYVLNFNQNFFPKSLHSTTLLPFEVFLNPNQPSLTPEEHHIFHQVIQFENLLSWATKTHFFFHLQEPPSPLYYILRLINPNAPIFQWETKTQPFTSRQLRPFIIQNEKIRLLIENFQKNGLSFSAIRAYLDCPLKFYYTYVENFQFPESEEEVLSHIELGTILHLVLQKIKDEKINIQHGEDIKQIVSQCVKDYFAIHKSHWLIDLQLTTITQNVLNVLTQEARLRKILHQQWNIPLMPDSLQEVPVSTQFNWNHNINIPLIGNLDIIYIHNNQIYSVVDYKNSTFYFNKMKRKPNSRLHPILQNTLEQLNDQNSLKTELLKRDQDYQVYPYIQILFYAYLLKKGSLVEKNENENENRGRNFHLHDPFLVSLVFARTNSEDHPNGYLLSILIENEVPLTSHIPQSMNIQEQQNLHIVSFSELQNLVNTFLIQFLNSLTEEQKPNLNHCGYCQFRTLCHGILSS